jgi:hypothetical protein
MRAAAELQVGRGRGTAVGERDDMMVFEKAELGAAAVGADEGASAPVACPHLPLNRGGHVT